jgi:hypothetical protein
MTEPKVVGLVYVAAFAPDKNESAGVWESRTERRKPLRKVGCKILDDALWCENEKAIARGPQFLERDHNSPWMLRVLGKLMSPNDLR